MVQFGVLGPLQVARDGHELAVKGPKLRVLSQPTALSTSPALP